MTPRENPRLLGHAAAEAALAASAQAGRLHHAWLITGPPGIGKATLAFRFARWLLAGSAGSASSAGPVGGDPSAGSAGGNPSAGSAGGGPSSGTVGQGLHLPQTHPVFRRVGASAHADLLSLAPNTGEKGKKQMIRVEEVRGLRGFMSLTPAEGGYRVVVLEEPETMDRFGQNAILKTLEEPPPRAVLLLTSSAPGQLLPTIRSRVRRLELSPLGDAEMGQLLPDMPAADRAMLLRIAGGSPGRALQLAEGEGLAMARLGEEALSGVTGSRAVALAEQVAGRDAAPMIIFFALLRAGLAAGVRAAATGHPPAWVGARALSEWSDIWGRIGAHARTAEVLNLERKQAVLVALNWLR